MARRRTIVGAVAAVLLLALIVLLAWVRPRATEPAAVASAVSGAPIPPTGGGIPSSPSSPPVPVPQEAVDREGALQALGRVEGSGTIRCAVPELPDGPVRGPGLDRSTVTGGVLTASVVEPEGAATVGVAKATVVRWSGAEAGRTGRCEVEPAETVSIGVVRDGGPAGVVMAHCAGPVRDGSVRGGTHSVDAVRGVPCVVVDLSAMPSRSVLIEDPQPGLVVDLATAPGLAAGHARDAAIAHADRVDEVAAEESAYGLALADPTLPDGVRAALLELQEEDLAAADRRLEVLREVRAMQGE